MILDCLQNAALYEPLHPRFASAFEYLRAFDPKTPDGRVDIQGDDLFALVQGYETRPVDRCRFEAHRQYIDIQFVCDGAEAMGWAPLEWLPVEEPYSEEKDVAFLLAPPAYPAPRVAIGMFTIFFPQDAHQPGMRSGNAPRVRKVVVKVRV